jgi:hypothetical protein
MRAYLGLKKNAKCINCALRYLTGEAGGARTPDRQIMGSGVLAGSEPNCLGSRRNTQYLEFQRPSKRTFTVISTASLWARFSHL